MCDVLLRDQEFRDLLASSPHSELWYQWLQPYRLAGNAILPADSVPAPNGINSFGNWHAQLWPNTYNTEESAILMGCFKARRHDSVAAVECLHLFVRERCAVSPALKERLRNGGTAWFTCSPHNAFRSYDPSIGWTWVPLEPHSPAMRETLEWFILYLCLGWEIPQWGPLPGVWFEPGEWKGVLDLAEQLLAEGTLQWIRLPYTLRRMIEQSKMRNPLPVLASRLDAVSKLMRVDWPGVSMASQLTAGVRQF